MRALALIALALLPCAAAADGLPADPEADFRPDRGAGSIALGPMPLGDVMISLDVGWLRSGLGVALGVGGAVDLVLRADTLLLYDAFSGPSTLAAGLRYAPVSQGPFRLSIEVVGGQELVPVPPSVENVPLVRGELALGANLGAATPYLRASVRGLWGSAADRGQNVRDEEAGGGIEWRVARFTLGAEAYVWARPAHSGLFQWRLRGATTF